MDSSHIFHPSIFFLLQTRFQIIHITTPLAAAFDSLLGCQLILRARWLPQRSPSPYHRTGTAIARNPNASQGFPIDGYEPLNNEYTRCPETMFYDDWHSNFAYRPAREDLAKLKVDELTFPSDAFAVFHFFTDFHSSLRRFSKSPYLLSFHFR